jgi:hypothetical protein
VPFAKLQNINLLQCAILSTEELVGPSIGCRVELESRTQVMGTLKRNLGSPWSVDVDCVVVACEAAISKVSFDAGGAD